MMKIILPSMLAGACLSGLAILYGGTLYHQKVVASLKLEHSQTIGNLKDAANRALTESLAEGERRAQAMEKNLNEAKERMAEARRDADAADAVSRRLRDEIHRVRSHTPRSDSALAERSPAGSDPLDLLALLFSRADSRAGELARIADEARVAGLTCERMYDAL